MHKENALKSIEIWYCRRRDKNNG